MFLPAVHRFRSLAILAVIGMHLDLAWEEGSGGRLVERAVVNNATVLFLFVSGLLFQHLSRKFQYGSYLKSKVRNVLIPYVVMSLPALAYQLVRHEGVFAACPRTGWAVATTSALSLLTAAHMRAPFWFIPMITVFYLLAPLLLWLDRRPSLYVLLVPLLINAMLCHRPVQLNRLAHAFPYFLPVYLAGMCFSHYREIIISVLSPRIRWLALAIAALMFCEVVVLRRGGAISSLGPYSTEAGILDIDLILKLLVSVGALTLLTGSQDRPFPLLDALADISFGLFFVHRYVSDAFDRLELHFLHRDLPGNPLTFLLGLTVVTLASWAVILLVRRMFGTRSRLIIGC